MLSRIHFWGIILFLLFASKYSYGDYGTNYLGGGFVELSDTPFSRTFYVNPDSAFAENQLIPFNTLVQICEDACEAWNDLSSYTGITFSINNTDSTKARVVESGDGYVIFFSSGHGLPPTANGWYAGTGDVVLRNLNWNIATPCPSGRYDLQGTLVHELGHAMGLGDIDSLKTQFDENTMWNHDNLADLFRTLEPDDKAGAIWSSGGVMGGTLPYSQVWSRASSVTLPSNVFIKSGDSLLVSAGCTVNLNGHDIVAKDGGFVGPHRCDYNINTDFNPYIAVVKSNGNFKGLYHSLSTALDSLSTGGAGAYIFIGNNCTIANGETISIPANTTIKFGYTRLLYVYGTLNIGGGAIFDALNST